MANLYTVAFTKRDFADVFFICHFIELKYYTPIRTYWLTTILHYKSITLLFWVMNNFFSHGSLIYLLNAIQKSLNVPKEMHTTLWQHAHIHV